MNSRIKTVAAVSGAALLGAATVVGGVAVIANAQEPAVETVDVAVEDLGVESQELITIAGGDVVYTLPEGWGMVKIKGDGTLHTRGVAAEELGEELAADLTAHLEEQPRGSTLLIDLDTVQRGFGTSGATTMLLTFTDSEYAIAEDNEDAQKWMADLYADIEDANVRSFKIGSPNAAVTYISQDEALTWTVREYMVQLDGVVVTAHVAADEANRAEAMQDSLSVIESLTLPTDEK